MTHIPSPHHDERPSNTIPSLLVIHNISLPPGQFGGPYINQLFTGTLNPDEHPFFNEIRHLRVSAHCLIRRDGAIIQYVPFHLRAWHAGQSSYQGQEKCNDFSIGIELEGTDFEPFTEEQYQSLTYLTNLLILEYPLIKNNITGHSNIAPGRKTDPGPFFDWGYYKNKLNNY
ncbi:1,6-anhydro-N-acetylmuramyl-L-alanine amidase AmpD [Providencia sp. PROV221]|uniref:1,6-anhydro-N-acetylmuramyl-L-alanine amidase AmpD n=1 Tax=Providencia sp. PROV221 TaxID=2949916 RepID=UPI002349CE44|nr:1,6-anhydro-N-acetylmuramyl-L-alanine amidase AmpD [Providencia sp. PROV221]